MYELYLAHHGILGQKWGIRRYQNPDGSLTAAGKLRYAPDGNGGYRKLSGSERRAAEKVAKKRTAALEKARKARIEKAEYEKGKQEAVKSGDASKINKYFDNLSPEERRQALERMRTKQEFQRMLNNETQLVSQGESKTDKLMNSVSKATDWSEKGIRMYNVIAKINNAFNSEAYMPSIGGEWAGDRKRRLEAERSAELKRKKEEKEREKVEKLIRTGDEYTLLKNRGLFSAKDWNDATIRFRTEDALLQRMANQRIGEIKSRESQHANIAANYRRQSVDIWKSSKLSKDEFNKVSNQYTKEEQEEIRRARGWN